MSALLWGLTACGGDSGAGADGDDATVFMLLPNSTTVRFENRDAPLFKEAMAELSPDTKVEIRNAEGDPDKQQEQVEDAVTQGAAAIVLISADANLAAGSLEIAAQADVPVVLYEHDAKDGPADAQVLFDARQVGEEQGKRAAELINAMEGEGIKVARIKGNPGEYGTNQYQAGQDKYLEPLIDSGKIQVVCEQNITNWDPVEGQAFAEDCLTKENNDVDLFIAMNDGLAGAAVAALTTQGLEGKIPVTGGQDANVEALQFIVQGYQDNTIFKDLSTQAKAAAEVTSSIVAGDGVPEDMVNGEIDNGAGKIPAVFLPVENVTIDNIQKVVDAGVWTWEEICEGAEKTKVCKENL
jgi:D-xylose transport system substrate-binding protein